MNKKNNSCNEYFVTKENIKTLPFILGIFSLILSLAALYFAFASYYIGLALSVAAIVFSALIMKKAKPSASISLVVSIVAIGISLFIFIVNNFVY